MKKELYESYESSLKNKSYWEICLENDIQRSIYVYCPSINVKLFKDNCINIIFLFLVFVFVFVLVIIIII